MKIKGLVQKSTGSFYKVRLENEKIVQATLRGKLRLENSEATNPVAVGDYVYLVFEDDNYIIDEILPRNNYIIRQSTHNEHKVQILCSNITQAVFIASLEYPFTPLNTIDRFLVSAAAYHISTFLVFNKTDLLKKEKHLLQLQDYIQIYTRAGYQVIAGNVYQEKFIEEIKNQLQNQTTFVGGVSGVGKSTIINRIEPTLHLKTGEISKQTLKGRHTTTHVEMFPLSFGGYIIDAPGVREFHLVDFEPHEISQYFPEMLRYSKFCKFANCTHLHEPGCRVIEALENQEIANTRYNTYFSMYQEVKNKKKY
ncbi:MAG: putative ribosome biogenesis GTPase RsgA [Bacteroidia bacterium]|nr:MAG: putative ribosome biogenesis GTPase RsgA [Bacteroidia bacterium]